MHRDQDQQMDAETKQNLTPNQPLFVQHQEGPGLKKDQRAVDQGRHQEYQRRVHPVRSARCL
jgi:hypothetical protein